jgi:ribonuclease PH
MGQTHVLCNVSFVPGVPRWREGQGLGWLTAEYDMLPASTGQRRPRRRQGHVDGRTAEIQRLIGRTLRAVTDFAELGENSLYADCDVLQADGGTRTASITGAYIALCDAVRTCRKQKLIPGNPIRGAVAAVSVGMHKGRRILDLCYEEDVDAEVDFNIAMTDRGEFVEVQGTAEHACFTTKDMDAMIRLAKRGIRELLDIQKKSLARRSKSLNMGAI